VWCISRCECEYKLRRGCMRGVDGVEEDDQACDGTNQPYAARVVSNGGRRGSQVQGLPFRPFVDRCMGAVCGEREEHAEVRRCSIAPGR
jgi:hypothetical protein